ncbi:MAG: preQ(1) synthase [Verrucomicrobia bacterium]|nr:preQ(1) synthase [Verrucomicrobiota bacterium]MBU4291416.1 preQ(1) synthase [Verrucomicrobiota bacterium]MBU4429034.1 preQ(1) synthase [Verrucomicrobiota bacterium]MCG2680305.1 preQ(1) synthase [Kiritimatiellia bacterium]
MAGKQQSGGHSQPKGLTLLGRKSNPCPASPDDARLETFKNAYPRRNYWIHCDCPEFTSLCPITGQPDFGVITIEYIPDRRCIESKSLKLYLFSFRNFGTFYEAAVNRILDDLVKACQPRKACVTGKFSPRGGIAMTVTANYPPPRQQPAKRI